jgi:type III pantothenate kinase
MSPDYIVVASVATEVVALEVLAICRDLWPSITPRLPSSSAYAYGVTNSYARPESLGIDRWLGMLAAFGDYADEVCIVDCGTAITIDVVSKTGHHLGGLIAPGLRMMTKALVADTALLQEVLPSAPKMLATETRQAIASGTVMAAVGLIEGSVSRWAPSARLIMTGGDASIVAEALSLNHTLDPLLVFRGLALFCAEDELV